MKNRLIDLNNHLFSQIERLADEDLTGDKLREEIDRSKSMAAIAQNIIANGRLALDVRIAVHDRLLGGVTLPKMLEDDK